jgi:CheY-like chemotaxis protein
MAFDAVLVKPFTPGMLACAVEEAQKRSASPQPGPALPQRLTGIRLLVAEDNPFNQQVALELLEAEGARVSMVGDGTEAIEKVQEARIPFDAVLMDMRMPGLDGLEATRIIRTSLGFTSLPIIAMTANAMPSDRVSCLEAGMDDHIAKPIDREVLVTTLLRYVKRETEQPVFEARQALERFANNDSTFERVLAYWLDSSPNLQPDLEKAAAEGPGSLVRFFHSLKGSAATVGGSELALFARKYEAQVSEDAQGFRLDEARDGLRSRVSALRDAVEEYLKAKEPEAPRALKTEAHVYGSQR